MIPFFKKFFDSITRKRSLEKSKSLNTDLNRCLSTSQLVFYGISNMVGAGIYVLSGHIIRDRAGPATNISFLLSGLISIFTGLCYCEFSTLIPKAGSCYTYTYLMLGELPAFLLGWTMLLDLIIAMSSVAKGFSGAVNLLCNNAVKNFTDTHLPLVKSSEVWDSSIDLVALLLLFVLFLVTLTGSNISMNINSFVAMIQISLLWTIIICCFIYGSEKNYLADGGYLPFGFVSIFQGAGIAIFAYSGFESLANSAEETKNPRKSIPIALFTSLGVVIVLYVMATTAIPFMVPRLQIDSKAPFIAAFANKNLFPLKWVAGIATLLATGASKLTSMYIIPRMIFAIAQDGLLFSFLGKVNERTRVPVSALIVGILFSMVLAMFVRIEILADITSMGIILSFIVIGIDLIILRYLYNYETTEADQSEPEIMKMRFPVHGVFTRRNVFKIVLSCLIFSLFLIGIVSVIIYPTYHLTGLILLIISIVIALCFLICLSLYEPHSSPDAFETPLMPLAPVITIAMNVCLLMSLPGDTWLRFLIWILIGLFTYFVYGIRNSNLAQADGENEELVPVTNEDSYEKPDKIQ